jgi:hypothetical protein
MHPAPLNKVCGSTLCALPSREVLKTELGVTAGQATHLWHTIQKLKQKDQEAKPQLGL